MLTLAIDASRANRQNRTGVENYSLEVIEELKKQIPNNIRVVLYSQEKLMGKLAILPENWYSKVLAWPPKRFWTQIRLSVEILFNRPDILFIPAHVFPFIHPKKTVMTIHDIAALDFPKSYNRFEGWYSIWSAKKALKKMWKIITPSEFSKNELRKLSKKNNLVDKKVFVTHLGFRKKENIKFNFEIQKQLGIKDKYLISISRLEEKKNTWRIIKAFENIKRQNTYEKLSLVLVGKPGFGYEKIIKEINKSEFKKDIILTGWLNDNDTFSLLKNAEIFLFPSLYEGFGLPVLEAFNFNIPVLASKNNSLEEVGLDACGYFDALDIEDISRGILNILENDEIKNNLISKGKERLKDFSWQKTGQKTKEILLS